MKELIVSTGIYSVETVRLALEAYRGYASVQVREKNDRITLTFSECRFGEERTVMEFENYMIALENKTL